MNEDQVKAVLEGNEKVVRKIFMWRGQATSLGAVDGSDVAKSLKFCQEALDASSALIRLLQAEIHGI